MRINRRWAEEVIDHCAEFPNGAPPSSDITDTVTQAVHYLMRRFWVSHPDDDYHDSFVGSREEIDEDDYDFNVVEERSEGIYG